MNIQNLIDEYNAACEKHNCFLGEIDHHETHNDEMHISSEFFAIGRTVENGKVIYRGYAKDMDQEYHDIFVDEDNDGATFDSMDEVVEGIKFYYNP